jgi:hypothetical protein
VNGRDVILLSCRLVLANRFIRQLLPSIFDIFLQLSWGRSSYAVWPESTVMVIFSFKFLVEKQIGKLTTINMGVKAVVLRNGYDVKDFCNF